MKVAIMQPYFLPYVGYFQLIGAVDAFVVYDNIKYTKKGWINRNRMLRDGADVLFSVPLAAAPDTFEIRDRRIAPDFDRLRLLNRIREAYRAAPCYDEAYPCIAGIVSHEEANLFRFLHHAIAGVCNYIGIGTRLVISSAIDIDHGLRGEDRVVALCRAVGATTYINAIGGTALYSRERFAAEGIRLAFLQTRPFAYPQFGHAFVPWLSILDVMMFNPVPAIRRCIASNFDLV